MYSWNQKCKLLESRTILNITVRVSSLERGWVLVSKQFPTRKGEIFSMWLWLVQRGQGFRYLGFVSDYGLFEWTWETERQFDRSFYEWLGFPSWTSVTAWMWFLGSCVKLRFWDTCRFLEREYYLHLTIAVKMNTILTTVIIIKTHKNNSIHNYDDNSDSGTDINKTITAAAIIIIDNNTILITQQLW